MPEDIQRRVYKPAPSEEFNVEMEFPGKGESFGKKTNKSSRPFIDDEIYIEDE